MRRTLRTGFVAGLLLLASAAPTLAERGEIAKAVVCPDFSVTFTVDAPGVLHADTDIVRSRAPSPLLSASPETAQPLSGVPADGARDAAVAAVAQGIVGVETPDLARCAGSSGDADGGDCVRQEAQRSSTV